MKIEKQIHESPMKHRHPVNFYLAVTLAAMLFIFIQSAFPASVSNVESRSIVAVLAKILGVDRRSLTFLVRKSAHFIEYLILGSCLMLLWDQWKLQKKQKPDNAYFAAYFPWLTGSLYAVSDEFHQRFVSGRSCELRDILIDSCGVAIGAFVIALLNRRRRPRRRRRKARKTGRKRQ